MDIDINTPNEQGNTPLHLVFINFSKGAEQAAILAKILISKGADLNAKNKSKLTVLHLAV